MKSLYLILAATAVVVTCEPQRSNDIIWYPVDDEDGIFISTIGEKQRTSNTGKWRSHRRARFSGMEQALPLSYDPSENYDPSFFHDIQERRPFHSVPKIPPVFHEHQFPVKRPNVRPGRQGNQNENYQEILNEVFGFNNNPSTGQGSINPSGNEWGGNFLNQNNQWNGGQRPENQWNGEQRPENQWNGGQRPENQWNGGQRPENQLNGEQRPGNQWNGGQRPGNQWNGGQRPENQWNGGQRPGNQWNGGQRPGNQWNGGQRPGNQWNGGQRPGNQWNGGQRPGNQWNGGQRPGNQWGNAVKPVKKPGNQWGNTVNSGERPDVTRPVEKPTSEWITPETQPGSQRPDRPTGQSDKLVFPEQGSTSTRPTTTPSNMLPTDPPTLSPCELSCPVTPQFNPVCGSDSVTYSNAGRLKCAQMCGKDVRLSHYGNCGRTPFSTPLVSSNPRLFW